MKDTNHLTLEQKVGQLFVLGFQGYELDRDTRTLLDVIRPGGFLLFQRNIESFDQIYGLTSELRNISATPAILAIDHEGGRVDRLKHIFAPIPSMPELVGAGMAELRLGARIIAAELEATGFNLDLAPVLDLRLPDSIVAERCLAPNPTEVVRFASAFIEELSKRRIVACAKHFPGLGGAVMDPHFSLPRIDRKKRQIQQEDAAPFVELFDQAALIMVSHAHYPALGDEKPVPASLSTRVVGSFLRKRLGYKGLTITDDLTMGAVTTLGLTPELFLRAFEAGNDLLLFSQTTPLVEHAFKTILKAARTSETLRRRIDTSVERILGMKGRIEFLPLRYRTHLKARITRQIDKLRTSLEPVKAIATRAF
jgi:beta-N-acetylhexosaminidase